VENDVAMYDSQSQLEDELLPAEVCLCVNREVVREREKRFIASCRDAFPDPSCLFLSEMCL
jgi:hypothetical protein